ncbi:MAG TPA: DnaB-like helicase C-terminal domain-containing protein, partial [Pirellulaceae bacterium]|nr:DnaB-like helicase C-terminal domain-containing protein [Pirellulaceae bacterium]
VAKMSRRLKVLARELQIPIICLSQLNRQADDASKPPRLSQLRESGAIEQDADAVLFIHRPDANKPESQVPSVESVELHVAKQRNGPTGIVELRWHRSHCSFESADDAWKERTDSSFDDWNNSGADDTPGA